jgi:kumamolisin
LAWSFAQPAGIKSVIADQGQAIDAGHESVEAVYFAGCGDSRGTYYSCASPNVVGVGGISISRDPVTGDFIGEPTWSLAGGGPSQYESRPVYQSTISKIVGSARGAPDLFAVANPHTPRFLYVSDQGGRGGVSVATPVVAGMPNFIGAFRTSSNAELTYAYINQNKYYDIVQGYFLRRVLGR